MPDLEKTCPECAETVKAEAKLCRFCGFRWDAGVQPTRLKSEPPPVPPAKPAPAKPDGLQVLQALLTLGAIGGFIWFMMKPTDCSGEKRQVQAEQSVSTPSEAVTAHQILEAYQANEVAAGRRFQGKTIDIYGTVYEVSRSLDDVATVNLDAPGISSVTLTFSKAQEAAVGRLSKGQEVRARCLVDEYFMGVRLKGCRLL